MLKKMRLHVCIYESKNQLVKYGYKFKIDTHREMQKHVTTQRIGTYSARYAAGAPLFTVSESDGAWPISGGGS